MESLDNLTYASDGPVYSLFVGTVGSSDMLIRLITEVASSFLVAVPESVHLTEGLYAQGLVALVES